MSVAKKADVQNPPILRFYRYLPQLETEVQQELKTIAQTPPYESVQIVHMEEKILNHCLGYGDSLPRDGGTGKTVYLFKSDEKIPGLI